jgi:hypothetical protein
MQPHESRRRRTAAGGDRDTAGDAWIAVAEEEVTAARRYHTRVDSHHRAVVLIGFGVGLGIIGYALGRGAKACNSREGFAVLPPDSLPKDH